MKGKWLWIVLSILAVALVVLAIGIPLWHLLVLQPSPEPEHTPTTTATVPAEDVVIPGHLTFTGKVLEVDSGMALMECYDKEKFDTVWVNYAGTPSVTPQVGEEYTVTYEDLVMPSLPPRITAVEMLRQRSPISTGEALYNDVVDAVISAYPWGADPAVSTIPEYPEMSDMYLQAETLSQIGYALVDLDGNGQKELLIGRTDLDGFPYDCFTIRNEKLVHVFSSGERDSFTVMENGYARRAWSNSAVCNGVDYYRLVDGELHFLERVTYDAVYAVDSGVIGSLEEANDTNCYFHSLEKRVDGDFAGYRPITVEGLNDIQGYYKDYNQVSVSYIALE